MSFQSETGGARAMPRRSRLADLIPVGVGAGIITIIAWSAWPLLRPARTIEVEQAITAVSNESQETSNVSVADHKPMKNTRMVQAAGWLEAQPFSVAATALTDGVVEEMLILEGDRVELGQPLARLVDVDAKLRLHKAQASYESAQAALKLAQARLAAAEQIWESPYELQRAVDSAKAHIDGLEAQLIQLPSLIRAEQALLESAIEEHKRIDFAFRKNAAAEIEYIEARENEKAQAARLEAMQARERILKAAIKQAQTDLLASEIALELRISDRERLETSMAQSQLASGDLAYQAAVLEEAKLELERMTIYAPVAGYVQRRLKSPGDKVMRGMDDPYSTHIAHIYDPSTLQVRVDVPLADASQVFLGQRCEVVVEILPDRIFEGEVLIITHQADLQKNTLQIKVRVIDPDPVLRPDMLTRVKFLPANAASQDQKDRVNPSTVSVRVPAGVIDSSANHDRVWVITERQNGQGVLRPIEVFPISESDGWMTVNGDLEPGSLLAVEPKLCSPGERVRFVSSRGGAS